MRESTKFLVLQILVLLLAASLVIQSVVGMQRRHAICARGDATLDVLHDVIALAGTPPPGKPLTAAQVRRITAFETAAFARIDRARC